MAETIIEEDLSNPTAATETTLYQVASGARAVVGGIVICNRNASARTIKIKKTDSSNTLVAQIVAGYSLAANDTIMIPKGKIGLKNQQKIRVESSGADVDFSLVAIERT